MSFAFSLLRRVYGVDGWLCLDGQTLRTACTGMAEAVNSDIESLAIADSEHEDMVLAASA